MVTMLERVQAMLRGEAPDPPVARLVGFRLVEVAPGRAVFEIKPVWNARLRAESRVVKRGKTVGLVECDVVGETGSLVARASSTCLTLSGDKAAGR